MLKKRCHSERPKGVEESPGLKGHPVDCVQTGDCHGSVRTAVAMTGKICTVLHSAQADSRFRLSREPDTKRISPLRNL